MKDSKRRGRQRTREVKIRVHVMYHYVSHSLRLIHLHNNWSLRQSTDL